MSEATSRCIISSLAFELLATNKTIFDKRVASSCVDTFAQGKGLAHFSQSWLCHAYRFPCEKCA